jgi:repressor LexA
MDGAGGPASVKNACPGRAQQRAVSSLVPALLLFGQAVTKVTACLSIQQTSMTSELTPRQREILRLIQESVVENGMPPTRAEIATAMGFKSANAAEEHLRALQRKGVIDLIPGASRGIQLKDSLREQLGLPLIGRVAAGRPMLAEEHIEARYQIDPKIFQPKAHYLLKVKGMSMKDIGILDGDLVAVHRTPEVRNRQVVVARLDDEVTVKRYKQDGKTVWLLPENEEFEPIRVNMKEQSLIIEGVVVGVLRQGKTKGFFQ